MKTYDTRKQAWEFYHDIIRDADKAGPEQRKLVTEKIGRHDIYFLATWLLDRHDDFTFGPEYRQDKIFELCRMVQLDPNFHMDLWARFHYKTSIITQLMTVQDILNDPEMTIAIFSFNNVAAKGPYLVVKRYLEYLGSMNMYVNDTKDSTTGAIIKGVLYKDTNESLKWTEDEGLIVKREGNPREATLNSFGLIDSLPTGSHFKLRIYDDVVTQEEVTNIEMIRKVIRKWELSCALIDPLPVKHYGYGNIARYVGTRYDLNDPYVTIEDRGVPVRKIPATHNGKKPRDGGVPILLTVEELDDFAFKMGEFVENSQMYLDPSLDAAIGFDPAWLQYYQNKTGRWWLEFNRYILCDPASEKKKTSDYTVILVIGIGADNNYYLIDGVRDRLNLTERTDKLIAFHRMYRPEKVGYEKYGKDSDIEHIEYVQNEQNYRFKITPLGGKTKKNDRIGKLSPIFQHGRFILPPFLFFIDYQKKQQDLIIQFVHGEYVKFPFLVGGHDDIFDCMARIIDKDMKVIAPEPHYEWDDGMSSQPDSDYDVLNYMNAA